MDLETASGLKAKNVSVRDLKDALGDLNDDNEYLILSAGDDYIQCAWSDGTFVAEYQDSSGHYESEPGLSPAVIEQLFTAYLETSEEWKALAAWSKTQEGTASSADQASGGSIKSSLKDELSPGKILNSVKSQVSREIGRGVNRKVSGIVGRVVRKFFK